MTPPWSALVTMALDHCPLKLFTYENRWTIWSLINFRSSLTHYITAKYLWGPCIFSAVCRWRNHFGGTGCCSSPGQSLLRRRNRFCICTPLCCQLWRRSPRKPGGQFNSKKIAPKIGSKTQPKINFYCYKFPKWQLIQVSFSKKNFGATFGATFGLIVSAFFSNGLGPCPPDVKASRLLSADGIGAVWQFVSDERNVVISIK